MGISEFVGRKMSITARITSGIVSIVILCFIFVTFWVHEFPREYVVAAFLFLAFHLINQLYAAILDLENKIQGVRNGRRIQ